MNTLINPALKTVKLSRFGEHYFPAINQFQFEKLDSTSLFNSRYPEFKRPNFLHFVIGFDSGLLANYVMESSLPKGSKFIFIELEEVLEVLNIDIPSQLQDDIFVCTLAQLQPLLETPSLQIYFDKKAYSVVDSLGASVAHLDNYIGLKHSVGQAISTQLAELGGFICNSGFVDVQLDNLADNEFAAKSLLADIDTTNASCIIIAGGPSLDQHINWIKQHQSQLFIISVSRVAGKLYQAGITPHLIVTVDPFPISFSVSRGLFELADKSILVNGFHAVPDIVYQWSGTKCYLGNRYPWKEENNYSLAGPTVSNSAVRLAVELGFKQILFSGVDLCFSPEGHTHASGSIEAELNPVMLGHIGQWVKTNDGQLAETTLQMFVALGNLYNDVSTTSGVDFINLAAQAGAIEGVRYVPTEDLCLGKIMPSADVLLNHVQQKVIAYDRLQALQQTRKNLNDFVHVVTDFTALTIDAIGICKSIKQGLSAKKQAKAEHKLSKVEAQLHQQEGLADLLKGYGYRHLIAFISYKVEPNDPHGQFSQLNIYYQSLQRASEAFLVSLQKSIRIVDCRINELTSSSISTLKPLWESLEQVARVKVWLKSNEVESQNEQVTSILQAIGTAPDESFTRYQNFVKSHSKMDPIRNKLEYLRGERHLPGLTLMVKSLAPFTEKGNHQADNLYALAQSFMYEIAGDMAQAKQAILRIDKPQRELGDLKQIINTCLRCHDLQAAMDAFVAIAEFTDAYRVPQAKVLRLLGNIQESVNIFLDHLEKYPEDLSTWLTLGLFMFDIEQKEAAVTAFNHALALEPDNALALQHLSTLRP